MNEMESEDKEEPSQALRELEMIIQAQLDFSNDERESDQKGEEKVELPKISKVAANSQEEDSHGKVAFKLFSNQSQPRSIYIDPKKDEEVDSNNKPIYPSRPLPLNRILDVEDEPESVRETRRKRIENTVVGMEGIIKMANQLCYRPKIPLNSYKVLKKLAPPKSSTSKAQVSEKFDKFSNVAIIDDPGNPKLCPKTRIANSNGVQTIVHTKSLIPSTRKSKKGTEISKKSESRRRRRNRQKERKILGLQSQFEIPLPQKRIKVTCL